MGIMDQNLGNENQQVLWQWNGIFEHKISTHKEEQLNEIETKEEENHGADINWKSQVWHQQLWGRRARVGAKEPRDLATLKCSTTIMVVVRRPICV